MEGQAKSSWFGTATETGFRRAILQSVLITLITWFGGPTPSAAQEPDDGKDQQVSTADDFLRLTLGPIAIGHHGVGPYNPATNPGLPIENTVDSLKLAYSLGARVVEVDVQLTQDGKLAVFHDDFLSDFTCIHSLTLDQLQTRLPLVPELHQVLDVARHVNREAGDDLGGILIVELKAFSPHCDPADEFEQPLVTAAVNELRQAKMTNQVMFDSFSPALLYLAGGAATAWQRRRVRRGGALASHARICRSCEHRGGLEVLRLAGRGRHLQHHSHGRKFAAADSRHLSAGAGGLICPSWKRRLSGIAEGITSLPLRGSAKGLVPAGVPLLRDADFVEELGEARLGAQRVGDGIHTKVHEAVVVFLVGAVKPIERSALFAEAQIDGGEIERGNIARLSDVLEICESFACARRIAGDSERMSVQSDQSRTVARELAPFGK